jgi:hypothetical protein
MAEQRPMKMIRRTLCGVIESLADDYTLHVHDVINVILCDTTLCECTRIDFPHIPQKDIISHVKLDGCKDFPIPFTVYYDAEDINSNLCYGIRCDILDRHEQVKYSSERFIPVLTDKYPKTNVHITVVRSAIVNDKVEHHD